MAGLVRPLDRGDGQRVDGEFAAKDLQHAQFLHAHLEVDSGDLEGHCIGGVVQMKWYRVARDSL